MSIMEELAERVEEVDGGLECPTCGVRWPPVAEGFGSTRLVSVCPRHGHYRVDMETEWREECEERRLAAQDDWSDLVADQQSGR